MTGQDIASITTPMRGSDGRAAALSALRSANAARDRGDWSTAAENYRAYLEFKPRRFAIWVQYGHALKESGRRAAALAAYSEALRLNPDDADLLLNLGHLHKLMGLREDAAGFYRRSAQRDPNPAVLRELEAIGASFDPGDRTGRPVQASAGARRPVALLSGARKALIRGNAARDARDWAGAVEAYRTHLKARPDNFPIWVQLGHALKESGRPDAALGAYGKALSLNPADADLLVNLGHLHKLMGRRDEAVSCYRKSAQLDPTPAVLGELEALGETFDPNDRTGRPVPPAPRSRRRIGLPAGGRRALVRGNAARDAGDWAGAAEAYRAHLKARPDNFPIWVQLGHALKESGRPDAALSAYSRAMDLRPGDADLLLNLGHLNKLMDRREDAARFYQRSFDQDGNVHARRELDSLIAPAPPPAVAAPSDADQVILNSALSGAPLVSIVIPNFNGRKHLADLFESLSRQTYRNFEIIFVDDNSTDDSAAMAERLGAAKVIKTTSNVGFATANNLGLEASRGELIALLNNDTTVDPNWLESLVLAIRRDPRIAATVPKIRFWGRFQSVSLVANHPFTVDRGRMMASLSYRKIFVRKGDESRSSLTPEQKDGTYSLEVDIPIQPAPVDLVVASETEQMISMLTALSRKVFRAAAGTTTTALSLGDAGVKTGFHILNNVGSMEFGPLKPGDRGFGERDFGQYDEPGEVDLLCGCSAVIRRDALQGRKLFIDEFVAYYEDSELSKRLRANGYTIQYCPQSIVYHKHSATNVEKSVFWRKQTSRNAVLFEYMHVDPSARPALIERAKTDFNHIRQFHQSNPGADQGELGFAEAVPALCDDLDRIAALIDTGQVPARAGLRIGVYNSFWKSLGGGEAHALNIAMALTGIGQVELISEEDFDLEELARYFNVDPSALRKRIVREMTPAMTEGYDVFVNSRYQSELVSRAKCSLFVVSFPSRTPASEFLSSYYFLANSEFTWGWMERYWGAGRFRGEVLYPSIPSGMLLSPTGPMPAKRKLVLSVGRFASGGHTKSQLEIAQAFRTLCANHPVAAEGWSLVLAGSADDDDYVSEVMRTLDGLNASIILNATFEQIRVLFRDASVYVHACGFGRQADADPERFEHFGMVVAQALGAGCVPVVYGAAGPQEIVRATGAGYEFQALDGLVGHLAGLLQAIAGRLPNEEQARKLVASAQLFAADRQRVQFNQILAREAAGRVELPALV